MKGYSLPECPDGVSEPTYANFMFTKHCHVCWILLHLTAATVYWRDMYVIDSLGSIQQLCLTPEALHVFPAQMVRYCRQCVDDQCDGAF